MKNVRLDKYLADCGCGTRTEVKKYIRSGIVTINGRVNRDSGEKVDPEIDTVCCGDRQLSYRQFQYIMLHKPSGCVTATKDNLHKTVMDYLPDHYHRDMAPVGRLDLDTEGLLLITNDGEMAHGLLAPGRHVEKTYYAKIEGCVTEKECDLFAAGLDIGEEKLTKPAKLEILSVSGNINTNHTDSKIKVRNQTDAAPPQVLSEILITVTEGKFHQVKRMFQAVGMKVLYLKRIAMGPLLLDQALAPGEYRFLTTEEIIGLENTIKRNK